jgi:cytoskeletal protein RodZ
MAESEKPAPENNGGEAKAPQAGAGEIILAARQRAGLTAEKVCADLRISPATLSALESGDYGKLAGAPYTRALLVSLSRYLRLDSRDVLAAYAAETGHAAAATAPVSPYKDDSKTHARAHKQIFILIVVGLLLVLLLIVGKVSSTSPEDIEPVPPPTSSDTLLNIDPASDSLMSDSLGLDSLALDTALSVDTAAAPLDGNKIESARDDAARIQAGKIQDAAEDKAGPRAETLVRIQALSESVYVRVMPAGRRERSHTLSPGKVLEVKHDDAITFITRNSGTVEVTVGGTTVVPDKRRFKVDGSSVTY